MKTSYLCLCAFLFGAYHSNAQDLPFPADGAQWAIEYEYFGEFGVSLGTGTETITPTTDSIFNGDIYTGLSLNDYTATQRFVRQDGQKIYFIASDIIPDSTLSFLAFDFGLEAGDTFTYPSFIADQGYAPTVTIAAVDSITTLDGVTRKRLELSVPFGNLYGETTHWIEGIGSYPNPFYFYDCFERQAIRYTYLENTVIVLDKNLVVSNKDLPELEAIEIYPNPSSDFLNIKGDETIERIRIFDLQGKKVFQTTINKTSFEADLPKNMVKGNYILQIELKNKRIINKKFQKIYN